MYFIVWTGILETKLSCTTLFPDMNRVAINVNDS